MVLWSPADTAITSRVVRLQLEWRVLRVLPFVLAPALTVNLCRGRLPVDEQFLELDEIHDGVGKSDAAA